MPLTLEQLFRSHCGDVRRIVARLAGPTAPDGDVEDLVQQVFVAAHRALPSYRGEGKPTTWLYGIATRTVYGYFEDRKRRRRLQAALEEGANAAAEGMGLAVQHDTPEAEASRRQLLLRVWQILMKIKPKKRTVYVLYELEGLTGPEIAEALGVKEGTVWTRLHHARKELAAGLAREGLT